MGILFTQFLGTQSRQIEMKQSLMDKPVLVKYYPCWWNASWNTMTDAERPLGADLSILQPKKKHDTLFFFFFFFFFWSGGGGGGRVGVSRFSGSFALYFMVIADCNIWLFV